MRSLARTIAFAARLALSALVAPLVTPSHVEANAQVSVWPAVGLSVPVPNPASPPLSTSGATVTLTGYIQGLLQSGQVLTYDPLGGGTSPEVDYFQDALYASALSTKAGNFGGQVIGVIGHTSRSDGGEGLLYWDPSSTVTADGGVSYGSLSSGRWLRIFSDRVNVKWYGAKCNGSDDDTAAILAAHATGKGVYYPYCTLPYVLTQQLDLVQGGIYGEATSTASAAQRTLIRVGGGIATRGAIITKLATQKARPTIQNVYLYGASWDATTGVRCGGIDAEAPIYVENTVVSNFYTSGIFFHTQASGANGPYYSRLTNVLAQYNRQHGVVVGTGANVVALINVEAKWNGSPSYGVAPSVAGSYDGVFVSAQNEGNPASAYHTDVPQSLTIIGGDASYNSRYGWNFDQLSTSASVSPGYAEGNFDSLSKQARIGRDLQNVEIHFATVSGGTTSLQDDANYVAYSPTQRIFVGGTRVFPNGTSLTGYNYDLAPQTSGSIYPPVAFVNNSGGNTALFAPNQAPDGTALGSSGYSALLSFLVQGSSAIGIGAGAQHLRISNSVVALPQTYYQQTASGWNQAVVANATASAMPSSGPWTANTFVRNTSYSVQGGAGSQYIVLGWGRMTTGSGNVLNTDWRELRVLTGT
jgi:hypothetical protein